MAVVKSEVCSLSLSFFFFLSFLLLIIFTKKGGCDTHEEYSDSLEIFAFVDIFSLEVWVPAVLVS